MKTFIPAPPKEVCRMRSLLALQLRTMGYDYENIRMIFHLASKEQARSAVAKGRRMLIKYLEELL